VRHRTQQDRGILDGGAQAFGIHDLEDTQA
jgi:hypothetical protein